MNLFLNRLSLYKRIVELTVIYFGIIARLPFVYQFGIDELKSNPMAR